MPQFVHSVEDSVTRFGNLLDFGQVFKAFGNNKFAQISHKFSSFLVKSFLGNFYRHLAIFIWSHWWKEAINHRL